MLLSLLSKRTLHDDSRDSYGFTVRPQHAHRYREYSSIYKEEEGERSHKWKDFLEQQAESTSARQSEEDTNEPVLFEVTNESSDRGQIASEERHDSPEQCRSISEVTTAEKVNAEEESSSEKWHERSLPPTPSASISEVTAAEKANGEEESSSEKTYERSLPPTPSASISKVIAAEKLNGEEESPTEKRPDRSLPPTPSSQHGKPREVKKWADISPSLNNIDRMMSVRIKKRISKKSGNNDLPSIDENSDELPPETSFPSSEELPSLVRGGVPKDLRGEVWQAFVGVRTRRVEDYYQNLLAVECEASDGTKLLPEKLKKQIEKDLPRTFPGHPALNEIGRDSLRRVLSAYALHNPSVGYCQAMNFFAGLLLLVMPEENAFWALVGIVDDYFEGYFSQEMTEAQIDQLVFEDLMHENFPKLVNHLDYLGVEVAWLTGPWFLSIFVNTLPWESVLRVWDVILFEGNRVMLFRTALALMDLYGPALVTTKDAGDVITLMQTLTSSTFDSTQLVLNACMDFLAVTESQLQELRQKHRPAIVSTFDEKSKGGKSFKDTKRLASKLYSFKQVRENDAEGGSDSNIELGENIESHSPSLDEFMKGMSIDAEVDSLPDLQEQVVWLKVELCRLLEERRCEALKNEELEAAFMELVQEDNRMELAAKVEQLEKEIADLRQILADKKEAENSMVEVLLKVEQEQKSAEEARRLAEQEAALNRYELELLQEKYDKSVTALDDMEKRIVMSESMLEATLQYEAGQTKASTSPKSGRQSLDSPTKLTGMLSFWRDKSKGKAGDDEPDESLETDIRQE